MSEVVKIKNLELRRLLTQTQRIQNVGVRPVPQVQGTVLLVKGDKMTTCNIVRDGITSIAEFSAVCEEGNDDTRLVVADIPSMLGALSKHSDVVSLTQDEGKLRIKSGAKSTTLLSDERAKAFPHTKKTVAEWHKDSAERFDNAIKANKGKYTVSSTGDIVEPTLSITIPSNELLDGVAAGLMNNQKLNHYYFKAKDGELTVRVGEDIKGKTETVLSATDKEFSTVVGGGLEHILRTTQGKDCTLRFIDLSPMGGGISLLIESDGVVLFQRESAGVASD